MFRQVVSDHVCVCQSLLAEAFQPDIMSSMVRKYPHKEFSKMVRGSKSRLANHWPVVRLTVYIIKHRPCLSQACMLQYFGENR